VAVRDLATAGALTHSGDPDLARHVGNAVVKNDSRGHRIFKEHRDSTRRIDLAVAAVMAHAAASTVAQGPQVSYLTTSDASCYLGCAHGRRARVD
jgi:phage terminase large subunit-like protein